jgi:hypothetical protein
MLPNEKWTSPLRNLVPWIQLGSHTFLEIETSLSLLLLQQMIPHRKTPADSNE